MPLAGRQKEHRTFPDHSRRRLDNIQVGDMTGASGQVAEMARNGQGDQQISEDLDVCVCVCVSRTTNDLCPDHLMFRPVALATHQPL